MTLAETHTLLLLLQGWYGPRRVPADEATVAAWHVLLAGHDAGLVAIAARQWGGEKHAPPAPAELVSAVRGLAARRARSRALPTQGCPSCGGTGWQWRDVRDTVARCDRGCRPPVVDRQYQPSAPMTDAERDSGQAGLRRVLDALTSRGRVA